MKHDIVWTTQFKKDYKLALKRCLDIDFLDDIIRALSRGETQRPFLGNDTQAASTN